MAVVEYSKDIKELFVKAPALRERIERVLWFFPEIERIKVGRASRSAYYDVRTGTVRLTRNSSAYVIGHELTHYLQDKKHFSGDQAYPSGERSCDLFLFARNPALVIDVWEAKDSSYMGRAIKVPLLREHFSSAEGQAMINDVCTEALRRRSEGRRGYIRWAESRINELIVQRAKQATAIRAATGIRYS